VASKAEMVLKTMASSFAASSCDGVADIFRTKFLGSGP
jgi:hypothetical protein